MGWGRDSPSRLGSVMLQPGHTQDTWPTAARGAGATLHWHRQNPTPWGSQLGGDDDGANAERVGHPPQLQQGQPRSLLMSICLVGSEAQLTSCVGFPCPGENPTPVLPGRPAGG